MKQFLVTEEQEGSRLDVAITEFLCRTVDKDVSRSFVQKFIPRGVFLEGRKVKSSLRLEVGQEFTIDDRMLTDMLTRSHRDDKPVALKLSLSEVLAKLDIISEYDELIFINKARGMDINTLAGLVQRYLELKGVDVSELERGGMVHRLDKSVGGVVIFAKSSEAQQKLQRLFSQRNVEKFYITKVRNNMTLRAGNQFEKGHIYTVCGGIIRDVNKRLRRAVKISQIDKREVGDITPENFTHVWGQSKKVECFIPRGYRDAVMEMSMLDQTGIFLIKLITGRNHQIRATLKALGLFIEGDSLYGKGYRPPKEIDLWSVHLSLSLNKRKFSAEYRNPIGHLLKNHQ